MKPQEKYTSGNQQSGQQAPRVAADQLATATPEQSQAVPPPSQVIQPQTQSVAQAAGTPKQKNKNSTQNNLDIAEIRDGLVIMNDGSYRSVVMAQSINFDLMNPQEREAVEYAYQSFLNSLYFPIQIFVRSQKVDMRPYLEKLNKAKNEQENMLLSLLMEDYIFFISNLVEQTNIMDKKFYIVVPYSHTINAQAAVNKGKKAVGDVFSIFKFQKPVQVVNINEQDLEKAKTELKNRVQGVVNGLVNIGLQAIPLDTEELIELYYDFYNPDTARAENLKGSADLSAPVISKGEGEAPRTNLQENL